MPRDSRRKHGVDITVDDFLLKALEGGPATVNDILKHFERRVRIRLAKLRVRAVVTERAEAVLIVSSLKDCCGPNLPRRRSPRRAVSRAQQK